ncbi:cyclic nucleotide-binding domain-containing protein [Actinomadura rugatobispora]|uniref:Cyclic nucleotide-binding domain-containing protein n=1 Tax=Actinomadura rugatobispora TaxID=1994 RepID=A0ABW1A100_9ACTN|nr:hypothetical protein GCM10010200_049030 [Actinomadura rugatobispora]
MTRDPVLDPAHRFDPDNTGRLPDHHGHLPDQCGDTHRRPTAASHHAGRTTRPADTMHPAQVMRERAHPHHQHGVLQQLPPGFPAHGFWASLTREERHAFSIAATTKIYSAGAVLWHEGEVAGHLLVILSGYVRVSVIRDGHERIIATRGPGDIIGERAALLLRQRSAGIVALDVVRTLCMTTQQFAAFLSDHPRVVAVLERELYERLTESGGSSTDIVFPPDLTATALYTPAPAPPELGGAHRAPTRPTTPYPSPSPSMLSASPASALVPSQPAPATVPAPASGSATWAGQMCSIMFVDIAGFSAPHRNDDDRLAVRQVMYRLLREAFAGSSVPWDDCHREDRGDGAMIIVPPQHPTRSVVDPLIADLTAGLRRHNRRASDAVRIQLRVALHVGPVTHDDEGVAGSAVIHTARLLDAPILKEWLAKTRSDLGFIASVFVYENVIAHAPGHVVPASYQQVSCTVKESDISAWMHLSTATAAA